MKRIIYSLFLSIIFIYSHDLYSAEDSSTSSVGTEFYVAFPLNDSKEALIQNFAIYVTSELENVVTVYNKSLGYNVKRPVGANETIEISTSEHLIDQLCEINEFETVVNKGIKVTSESPISVHVFSSKGFSSEGYMAIPTISWGTDYIHNSFYDMNETHKWSGGFVLMAKEDFTQVVIKIKDGVNNQSGFGETTGGKKHGEFITITLNAGDVFTVQGNGETRGIFDLSGTQIVSNKPIGLVSYHNRALIPAMVVQNGRDFLVEMMPPISNWGKEYYSLQLERGTEKGDYFRVLASQNETKFTIEYFDEISGERISEIGPIDLNNKGDWYEYNGAGAQNPHNLESIRGVAKFKADKPILVVQYSYSAGYDGATEYDPFMIVLAPVEQYVTSALFTRPQFGVNSGPAANYISVIALGDSTDQMKNEDLLNSMTLNGTPLTFSDLNFVKHRIPGTNYYWTRIVDTKNKTFDLRGNTQFSTNLYGYSNFASYGWTAGQNYKILQTDEVLSSVTESNIVSDISLEIISANPMNISPIRFSISNKNHSNTTVNITDAEGRIIMELMNEYVSTELIKEYDISGLVSGTFFITASDGNNKIMRKFIITK